MFAVYCPAILARSLTVTRNLLLAGKSRLLWVASYFANIKNDTLSSVITYNYYCNICNLGRVSILLDLLKLRSMFGSPFIETS